MFRASLAERLGVAATAFVIIALTIFIGALGIGVYASNAMMAIVLAATAAMTATLAGLVTREAVSRWRLKAVISGNNLTGVLPRRRGFVDADRIDAAVKLSDIARIETREEVFSSLGVTTSQRAFSFVMRDGSRVFLGADREMLPAHFGAIASAVVSRSGAPVTDLGMVDGNAGFMLVIGQSAPEWSAAPLPPAAVAQRRAQRRRTVALLIAASLVVILARSLSAE